jgi:hypothetical protein
MATPALWTRASVRGGGLEKGAHGYDPAIRLPFLDEASLWYRRSEQFFAPPAFLNA